MPIIPDSVRVKPEPLEPMSAEMQAEVITLLEKARKRISTPDKWCQRVSARDRAGEPALAGARDACQFCIVGAVRAKFSPYNERALHELRDHLPVEVPHYPGGLASYNDNSTHERVLDLFNTTINDLRRQHAELHPAV